MTEEELRRQRYLAAQQAFRNHLSGSQYRTPSELFTGLIPEINIVGGAPNYMKDEDGNIRTPRRDAQKAAAARPRVGATGTWDGPSPMLPNALNAAGVSAAVTPPAVESNPTAATVGQSTVSVPASTNVRSAGGTLSNGRMSGADLVRQGLDLYGREDDYTAAQKYARQRAKEGDSSMLNALAAQFAGEDFQPVQAQYLRRAMAAQEPLQVGDAMVGPDGNVVVDPAALRQRRADKLIQLGQFEIGLEDKQDARREAAALRQSLAAIRGGAGGRSAPASIQAGDQRAVKAAEEQASAGGRAYDALSQMSDIMTRYKGGLIAPEIGMGQRALAAMGNDAAAAKVQDFERLQQLASTVGIETLSQIGGNDTDRELQTAIRTAFDPRNLTESNLPLIRLKAAAARVAMERPSEMAEWVARTGSLMYPDPQTGETWPRYWMRRQQEIKTQFGLKPSGNLQVSGAQPTAGAAPSAGGNGEIVVNY